MNIPKEILLAVILEHSDYLDLRKTGDGYRSSTAKNPSLVLSEDGWYDHKQGQGGSLFNLAKDLDLLDEARRRSGMDEYKKPQTKAKSTKTSPGTSDHAAKLWKEAKAKTP